MKISFTKLSEGSGQCPIGDASLLSISLPYTNDDSINKAEEAKQFDSFLRFVLVQVAKIMRET